jgi:glycosyltransferase involved in cell wall biosynthesis
VTKLVAAASATAAALTAHTAINLRLLRRPRPDPTPPGGLISVLVPARDEAATIGDCVRSILASRQVDFELLVLDDGSADGTADAARAAGAGDARARVLNGRALPAGWLGKPYACAQLAEHARGEVLVFVDADVRLEPDALASTVDLLRSADLQLVSPYPRQRAESWAERLVQPLLQWSWLTFLPLRLAEQPRLVSMTAANGQLLACDAAAYRDAGGHSIVRDAVLDDVWLARAFKRRGFRVAVADGTSIATCRMYDSWAALRRGYGKSLWAAFGSPRRAFGVTGLLVMLYVVPPVAAIMGVVTGRRALARMGATGYAAGVVGRVLAARATGGRALDSVAHPAAVLVFGALVAGSTRDRRAGRVQWKGRPVG